MQFQYDLSRRTTDIQIYDSNHRQNFTGQNDERKDIRIQKDDRTNWTEHLRNKKQEKPNTEGAKFGKRKTDDKRRTDTMNEKVQCETKNSSTGKQTMQTLRGIELDTNT